MEGISMQKGFGIPIAIVFAGLLIAGAMFWSNGSPINSGQTDSRQASTVDPKSSLELLAESDHVRGDANARVTIVEYSDFNCSFCARLHPTLSRIVDEYNGQVNWVYRHFANYPQGRVAAVGSECAARLGGNSVFWDFTDRMFDNQRRLGDSFSIETAAALGVDEAEFRSCLTNSGEIESKIVAQRNEAISLGGRGTPFSVIITANGKLLPFSGALPYEHVKGLVDQALAN